MQMHKILVHCLLAILISLILNREDALAQFDSEHNRNAVYNFNSQSSNRSFVPNGDVLVIADEQISPMLDINMPQRIIAAVSKYTKIKQNGGWTKISHGRPIKPGRWDSRILELRKRLAEEGYIDTHEVEKSAEYDIVLVEAIRKFQYNRSIRADGVIGSRTIEQLNIPPQYIIDKLRVNIARAREYSKDLTQDYVIVNVPSQTLEAVEDGRVYSRHNVITGSTERPTPMISSTITQINFNPYWNIPKSIVEKDILPNVRRSPDLLKRHNIRVFESYNGAEIDTEFVNWETVTPGQYHFRQDPGRQNAMDSVRINFSNRYSVYLHDTPEKLLFYQSTRYISSGCVRVDQIHTLTEWLLRDNKGWTKKHIEAIVDSLERFDADVKRKVSIRLVYMTAWVDNNNLVSLRHDPYNLDETDFVFGQPAPIDQEITKKVEKNNQPVIVGERKIDTPNVSEQISDEKIKENNQMSVSTSFLGLIGGFMQ